MRHADAASTPCSGPARALPWTEFLWDRMNRTRMGRYLTTVEVEFIIEGLARAPHVRTVLDVGGGSGRLAIPLQRRGYHVIVTEAEMLPLRWLAAKSPETPRVVTSAGAHTLPFRDGAVECILAIEIPPVYEGWFWAECRRVLTPRGLVIASTANRHSYKGMLHLFAGRVGPLGRKAGRDGAVGERSDARSARGLEALIRAKGFEIERAQGFNWLPVRRGSNSPLIPFFAVVEKWTGLRRLMPVSPWLLFHARVTPGSGAGEAARR